MIKAFAKIGWADMVYGDERFELELDEPEG